MAYDLAVRFLETRVFTAAIADLMSDDDYAAFQAALVLRPHLGVVIQRFQGRKLLTWLSLVKRGVRDARDIGQEQGVGRAG